MSYHKLLKVIKTFFIHHGQKIPFKKIGIFLYKTSVFLTIKYLTIKLPELKSVYSMTDIDSPWFRVGVSDLDLILVFSEQKDEGVFQYTQKIKRVVERVEKIFPFIWLGGSPFFPDDFRLWFKINNTYIHDRDKNEKMKLIYGEELRELTKSPNQFYLSPFSIRLFFEEILNDVYYNFLNKENYYRNTYKFLKLIIKTGYMLEKKNNIDFNSKAILKWISQTGCELAFFEKIKELPQNNYVVTDSDFAINLIYNLNIIIDYIGEKARNSNQQNQATTQVIGQIELPKVSKEIDDFAGCLAKENLNSIFLTKTAFIPNVASQTLYLIIENNKKEESKKQIQNILDNLPALGTELKNLFIKRRGIMYLTENTFPVIMFDSLLRFHQFVNGGCLNEAPNIKLGALTLFGQKPQITCQQEDLANGVYDIVHISLGLMNDLLFKTVFKYLLQHELLIKTGHLYLGNIIDKYNKEFNEVIDLGNNQKSYLRYRKIIKKLNNQLN